MDTPRFYLRVVTNIKRNQKYSLIYLGQKFIHAFEVDVNFLLLFQQGSDSKLEQFYNFVTSFILKTTEPSLINKFFSEQFYAHKNTPHPEGNNTASHLVISTKSSGIRMEISDPNTVSEAVMNTTV